MKSSSYQLNMHYGFCPKKVESRSQTIIQTYRNHYNLNSIPLDSQYWSICGRCSYELNKLEDNCEPDQLIKEKLIQPNQFYGVEIDDVIYGWNKQANQDINWILGDFYISMVEYANKKVFNPAIVNADLLLMPKNGVKYFSKIMQFLTNSTKRVMLIGNLVSEHRHFRYNINDIIEGLQKESCFQFASNNGNWKLNEKYYWYNGTGKTTTKMTTIVFFKE